VGYTGVRGMPPTPLLADSLRCISSCFAFRFRSSVASSSLFCRGVSHGAGHPKKPAQQTYPCNDFLYALLVAVHLEEGLDLANGEVLSVSQGNQLVEGAEQFVGILQYLALVQALACTRDHLGEEMQGVDVLENVGLPVGNEDHVELVQGLVHKADVILLDRGMLGTAVGQLRERCQQCFYPGPWHLAELPREDGLAASGADRGSEDNLNAIVSWRDGLEMVSQY